MEKQETSVTQTMFWIQRFKSSPDYGHMRFKKLQKEFGGYPPFDMDESLIDEVDLDTFNKTEETRITLFVSAPLFGINPKPYRIPNFLLEDKIVAILHRASFSIIVGGLSIYLITAGAPKYNMTKLAYFENEEI